VGCQGCRNCQCFCRRPCVLCVVVVGVVVCVVVIGVVVIVVVVVVGVVVVVSVSLDVGIFGGKQASRLSASAASAAEADTAVSLFGGTLGDTAAAAADVTI
jgi:hypothetical protein